MHLTRKKMLKKFCWDVMWQYIKLKSEGVKIWGREIKGQRERIKLNFPSWKLKQANYCQSTRESIKSTHKHTPTHIYTYTHNRWGWGKGGMPRGVQRNRRGGEGRSEEVGGEGFQGRKPSIKGDLRPPSLTHADFPTPGNRALRSMLMSRVGDCRIHAHSRILHNYHLTQVDNGSRNKASKIREIL